MVKSLTRNTVIEDIAVIDADINAITKDIDRNGLITPTNTSRKTGNGFKSDSVVRGMTIARRARIRIVFFERLK